MVMTTIGSVNQNDVAGFGQLPADLYSTLSTKNAMSSVSSSVSSGLKGALETQEMIQGELAQMMKDVTPHLGQNVDIRG